MLCFIEVAFVYFTPFQIFCDVMRGFRVKLLLLQFCIYTMHAYTPVCVFSHSSISSCLGLYNITSLPLVSLVSGIMSPCITDLSISKFFVLIHSLANGLILPFVLANLMFLKPMHRCASNSSYFHFILMIEKVPLFMGEKRPSQMHRGHRQCCSLTHTHSKHGYIFQGMHPLFLEEIILTIFTDYYVLGLSLLTDSFI